MPRFPHTMPHCSSLSDETFKHLVKKAVALNKPVYSLHLGDTYLEPLSSAQAEAQKTSDHERLHNYSATRGEPALLHAAANRLNALKPHTPINVDQIQIVPGATAALNTIALTLFEPGDEVLLLAPYWPLMQGMLKAHRLHAIEVPFFTELDHPGFDAYQTLKAHITSRTSAIYLNTPNNPTGCIATDEHLNAIARLAAEHDLWVLCDEAYEDLVFEGPFVPAWTRADLQPRSIVVHTVSKSYALAGARTGYVHGPEKVMHAIQNIQTFHTYCASKPMQMAAARALCEGEAWLTETRRLYHAAAQHTAQMLDLPVPHAGTFFFFDVKKYFNPGETLLMFLERCLAEGVLLTPGTACGKHYDTWIRLCFTCLPPDQLHHALVRLRSVFSD